MIRRDLITVSTGLGIAVLAGCTSNNNGDFEPNITETIRLGTADPLSLDSKVDITTQDPHNFEGEATRKANVRVHDHIGSMLRDQELLGAGVFLGIDFITADEIDNEIEEDEFERARPLATVVNQRYVYNENGELITQPEPMELDMLREELPRTVSVNVSSDSDQYTAVLPVVVHRFWEYHGKE